MTSDPAVAFIELGLVTIGLAILARVASRWGFSAIPLYLLAGLAFGNGGLAPLEVSAGFIHIGAQIGVVLLLFMLGLEYSAEELKQNLRSGRAAGVVDLALNFPPGFIVALMLGWKPLAALLLGGVTYISSSAVIAKLLAELRRLQNPETPAIISVLVVEDLAMAVYLPLVAVLLAGGSLTKLAFSEGMAVAIVVLVLLIAVRFGQSLSRFIAHESDEIILLTTFGVVLLVSALAERAQVSAAVGAFLVGIAVSGPVAERSRRLIAPLRDLFAAMFFFFFGLQVDPASLPPALPTAVGLGIVSAATKVITGSFAARRTGVDGRGRLRAGMALVARGEFSIVIAGLGTSLEPQIGPISTAYVLFLALLGPVLSRAAK
jgi:monovalent cation:H+ antiporter-2, CPA2 family